MSNTWNGWRTITEGGADAECHTFQIMASSVIFILVAYPATFVSLFVFCF